MFQRKFAQTAVLAAALISLAGFANAEQKLKRSIKRIPASGARVGSSNTQEITSLSEKDAGIDVSRVENATVVKKISGGRIALVQVDSGGSTDVSSLMTSSGLYLVFFQDGEMNNLKAAFQLDNINEFKVISNKGSSLSLNLKCKDENLKDRSVDSVISYDTFEKQFLNGKHSSPEEFVDIVVSGKISMSARCLPEMM